MTKILLGIAGVSASAAAVLFWLLLNSQQANGVLKGEIEQAADIAQRQANVIMAMEINVRALREAYQEEQRRAANAVRALSIAQQDLEREKREREQELSAVLESLSEEERECAVERVPDAYFSRVPNDRDSA